MSVLLTVNTVSHNPAQISSNDIPPQPPDNYHNSHVVYQMVGEADIYGAGTPHPEINK